MAVVAQMVVSPSSRAEADAFDAAMEAVMVGQGGPPGGLMLHLSWAHDDGFMLCQVWRAEAEMRAYYELSVLPQLAAAGLTCGELTTSPVWSLARP